MLKAILQQGRSRRFSDFRIAAKVCRSLTTSSANVVRFYTTRGSSPFSQTTPLPRSVNKSNTFVSSHYKIDENTVLEYLERKGYQFKENSDEFIVRECMFCPKPHYNKSDNLFKLYISKKTGAFICHRCGTCGSWFDFKRMQGDLMEDQSTPSPVLVGSPSSAKEGTDTMVEMSSQIQQFAYNTVKEYTANLRSQAFPAVWKSLTDRTPTGRWLTEETLRKYCVGACQKTFVNEKGESKTEDCAVFPWITLSEDGTPVVHRYKIRSIETKAHMRLEPHGGDWGFFGWHTVPATCQSLVITEGEYDAMAVYQTTGVPSISLPNGAASLPVRLLPLLENIKEIVLWMDFDRAGQENAQRFAKKLGQGRTRIVPPLPPRTAEGDEAPVVKDPCDCLRHGLNLRDFLNRAACLPHDQILTFDELKNDIYYDLLHPFELQGTQYLSIPFLNRTLKGHRRGELTILTGPTGSGKTTLLSQLSLDLLKQGVPTLWGSFEITNRRLGTMMLKQFSEIPVTSEISHQQFEGLTERFSQLPLYYLRFFGSTQILDAMEYSVYAYDVQHIILDNLQFMMGAAFKGYERFDAQEKALHEFRKFATQQHVHITLVIHPRKEPEEQALNISSVFGTAKATQEADNVIIIQNEGGHKRLEVKKNRFDGDLGSAVLVFNKEKLQFEESTAKGKEVQEEVKPISMIKKENSSNQSKMMGKTAHEIILG